METEIEKRAKLLKDRKAYSFVLENKNGKKIKRWGYIISFNDYYIEFWDELRYMEEKNPDVGILIEYTKILDEARQEPRVDKSEALKDVERCRNG